jgi:hypothetical protein
MQRARYFHSSATGQAKKVDSKFIQLLCITQETCFERRRILLQKICSYPLSPSPFSYMEAGFPQLPQCEQIAYQKPIHLQPEQVCLLRRAVLVMLAESLLYSFTCLRSIGVLMSISCSLHVSSTFL